MVTNRHSLHFFHLWLIRHLTVLSCLINNIAAALKKMTTNAICHFFLVWWFAHWRTSRRWRTWAIYGPQLSLYHIFFSLWQRRIPQIQRWRIIIILKKKMQYLMSGEPFWLPPFWKWIWLNFYKDFCRKRNKSQFFVGRTMDWGLGPARHPFHVFLKNASSTNWTCGKWGSSIPPLFPFLRLNCKGNIFFSYFIHLYCIQIPSIVIIMDGTSSSLSGNLKEKLLKNWWIWSESEFGAMSMVE